MTTEVSTVNIRDRIKERVASEFASIISEEEWDRFIRESMNSLVHGKDGKPSEINAMISEELRVHCAKLVKRNVYRVEAQEISKIVKETLTPEFIFDTMRQLVSSSLLLAINRGSGDIVKMALDNVSHDKCEYCARIVHGVRGDYTKCHCGRDVYVTW